MATKVWDSSDGDWSAAGSWSPSGIPTDNDDVVFPADNYQDVTSGLDQSGIDLDSILIREGCTINIGSTASPLILAADLIRHEGEGTLYLQVELATTVDQLVVNAPNWDGAVELVSSPGSIARLTVNRGKVTASGTNNGGITQAEISHSSRPNDAIVDFSDASTPPAITNLFMNSGRCKGTKLSNIYLMDGIVETLSDDAIVSLWQSGGIFDWRGANGFTSAFLFGGIFTTRNDLRPKTISAMYVWPGAIADLHENVTVTSGGNILNRPITG